MAVAARRPNKTGLSKLAQSIQAFLARYHQAVWFRCGVRETQKYFLDANTIYCQCENRERSEKNKPNKEVAAFSKIRL